MYTEINAEDIQLDPCTGMPTVPEFYYWEITKTGPSEVDDYSDEWSWENKVRYHLLLLIEKTWIPGENKIEYPWYYFGGERKTWIDGHYETEKVIDHIFTKEDEGSEHKSAYKLAAENITKEMAVNVSKRKYAEFLNEKRKSEETTALVGKYPPKKIWKG